jgi:preprotein translocase subunit SecA
MRLFGSERIAKLMDAMGAQEGEVLTHPLITRSIEQAQKRVELQNFQSRKRLLEYDDVMNQQREVIYSLRAFALEGGEELRGEAERMIEKAIEGRVEKLLPEPGDGQPLDIEVLRQELLMRYMLTVSSFETPGNWPTSVASATADAIMAAKQTFSDKLESLGAYSGQLLALVMLNVLDEKWKDHLYDLDQLRNAIHYRSWGQRDPLVEYKHEAYTMFVDLMEDIYHTFAERFARAQVVFEQQPDQTLYVAPPETVQKPTKRYNALGILEDIMEESPVAGVNETMDVAPAEPPTQAVAATRPEPSVVGLGRTRSLSGAAAPVHTGGGDWTNVGRNDPCPCGSGKKFKKCHGTAMV